MGGMFCSRLLPNIHCKIQNVLKHIFGEEDTSVKEDKILL